MSQTIDYIAFDLGRVIVEWNPAYLFDHLIPDAARRQYMLEHVVTMDWIEEVDRADNVAQAQDLGIQAVQFIDSDKLEADLTRLSVL